MVASLRVSQFNNLEGALYVRKNVLQKLCNDEHKSVIRVNFKMVNFLLGQQRWFLPNTHAEPTITTVKRSFCQGVRSYFSYICSEFPGVR